MLKLAEARCGFVVPWVVMADSGNAAGEMDSRRNDTVAGPFLLLEKVYGSPNDDTEDEDHR